MCPELTINLVRQSKDARNSPCHVVSRAWALDWAEVAHRVLQAATCERWLLATARQLEITKR